MYVSADCRRLGGSIRLDMSREVLMTTTMTMMMITCVSVYVREREGNVVSLSKVKLLVQRDGDRTPALSTLFTTETNFT